VVTATVVEGRSSHQGGRYPQAVTPGQRASPRSGTAAALTLRGSIYPAGRGTPVPSERTCSSQADRERPPWGACHAAERCLDGWPSLLLRGLPGCLGEFEQGMQIPGRFQRGHSGE
jgi:hypothetical protein